MNHELVVMAGSTLYMVDEGWNTNYLPRYSFEKVEKITPTGKVRLQNGKLLRADMQGWKLFTAEARVKYNQDMLRVSVLDLLNSISRVGSASLSDIPLEQLERLGEVLYELDITKYNSTYVEGSIKYNKERYKSKLDLVNINRGVK